MTYSLQYYEIDLSESKLEWWYAKQQVEKKLDILKPLVTGRLSFEKFVIRCDVLEANLHAERAHEAVSDFLDYKFSLSFLL